MLDDKETANTIKAIRDTSDNTVSHNDIYLVNLSKDDYDTLRSLAIQSGNSISDTLHYCITTTIDARYYGIDF